MEEKSYRMQIMERIDKIQDEKILKFICNIIDSFVRKWGY